MGILDRIRGWWKPLVPTFLRSKAQTKEGRDAVGQTANAEPSPDARIAEAQGRALGAAAKLRVWLTGVFSFFGRNRTKPKDPYFFGAVHAAEQELLRKRRPSRREDGAGDDFGLCLSGGGIRSAAFSIGALHGLVSLNRPGANGNKQSVLSRFDYLSTVSGGGYAGSALTWMVRNYENAGLEPSIFR